ncbi:MAG: WbqC family protein [Ferruginibacter sp.]
MRTAIMQPYIFPYIGYFQLINAVDQFVVYDNIQFTKKGWINRNRILVNGKDEYLSFPLKKDSDYLMVNERCLADNFKAESIKILRKIGGAYRKAPYFDAVFPLLESIINAEKPNLFYYIFNSLKVICNYIGIDTSFLISSSINIDHTERAQDKVISICKAIGTIKYINPIGGEKLYSKEVFKANEIELGFIRSDNIVYPQLGGEFVPGLSIIDVLMFNSKEKVKLYTNVYTII